MMIFNRRIRNILQRKNPGAYLRKNGHLLFDTRNPLVSLHDTEFQLEEETKPLKENFDWNRRNLLPS
jgi:hypothetical protein